MLCTRGVPRLSDGSDAASVRFLSQTVPRGDKCEEAHAPGDIKYTKIGESGDMKKTNAMRILDTKKIPYRILEYTPDENDLSGVHVAEQVGLPQEQVFKTLVVRGDKNGVAVFCIPCGGALDLKTAARLTGNKRVEMLHMKELPALTGYIRGGCSPIGMKKNYPTFLDESAQGCAEIAISAGVRGCQVLLSPEDLIACTGCGVAALLQEETRDGSERG